MKYFDWDCKKNELLQHDREVCFEDIIVAISEGRLLDVIEHPQKAKYPHQKIFIVEIDEYAYLIPFVEDTEKIFLKTIIPSRKATVIYLIKDKK